MKTQILNVPIDTLNFQETLQTVLNYVKAPERNCKIVITPNPEMVMLAQKDNEFMDILKKADLVIPDGIGVVLASKLNKVKISERVPGCDLCYQIFDRVKGKDYKIYLLGSTPGIAQRAKQNMEIQFAGLTICGVHDGYFDNEQEKRIIAEIDLLKPDILMVGIGFPRQEKWIYHNKDRLNVKLAMAIGGSIDVMAGEVSRAPVMFQKLGLEWFYRLVKQPSRFFRMLVLPEFAVVVLLKKMFGKN